MTKKSVIETRLKPPSELKSVAQKRVFNEIVEAYAGDFFNTGDLPLLLNYVRLKLSTDRLYKEVVKRGEVIYDKNSNLVPSPFFRAYNTGCTTMAALAQKLRIAPSARMRQEAPGQSAKRATGGRDYQPGSDWRELQQT